MSTQLHTHSTASFNFDQVVIRLTLKFCFSTFQMQHLSSDVSSHCRYICFSFNTKEMKRVCSLFGIRAILMHFSFLYIAIKCARVDNNIHI